MNMEGMNVLVWCYALRAVILIVFLMSLPIAWVGAKTQFAYLSSRLPVLISQFSSWDVVVCVGLASGVFIHRFMPYLFMGFTGKRKKRE